MGNAGKTGALLRKVTRIEKNMAELPKVAGLRNRARTWIARQQREGGSPPCEEVAAILQQLSELNISI